MKNQAAMMKAWREWSQVLSVKSELSLRHS